MYNYSKHRKTATHLGYQLNAEGRWVPQVSALVVTQRPNKLSAWQKVAKALDAKLAGLADKLAGFVESNTTSGILSQGLQHKLDAKAATTEGFVTAGSPKSVWHGQSQLRLPPMAGTKQVGAGVDWTRSSRRT